VNPHGVGLGLNISNTIVKLLNPLEEEAKIEFESEYEKGAVFKFKISAKLETEKEKDGEKTPKSTENIIICTMPETQKTCRELSGMNNSESGIEFDEDASSRWNSIISPNLCASPFRKTSLKRMQDPWIKPRIPAMKNVLTSPREETNLLGHTEETPRRNFEDLRIALIVDDNPINLIIVSKILESRNFSVVTALNGQEAIEKARSQKRDCFFKVIFMDCQMPIMDGFEASKRLKKMMDNREIPRTPIFALSANFENEKLISDCSKVGMSGYFSKPFKSDDLDKIINKIL